MISKDALIGLEALPAPPRLVSQANNHPWFDDDSSFVTQVWETSSHEASEQVAGMMNADGWSIYLVANCGTPSIVVYRKVVPDEDRIETCGMCSGHGTLTDDESESQCPHCDGPRVPDRSREIPSDQQVIDAWNKRTTQGDRK